MTQTLRTLVVGGARSGKSNYAESLAQTLADQTNKQVIYIATAKSPKTDLDSEMQARIARHQSQRNRAWKTLEVPIALGAALKAHDTSGSVIVIDCLTVWLSNVLFDASMTTYPEVGVIELPEVFLMERQALVEALAKARCDIVLVSNEVGMGIVPMGAINRLFVDESGRLNQTIAAVCERVLLLVAGCPLVLKSAAATTE